MLLSLDDPCWFYMEIPKTGTSAIYHALQHSRKHRSAECYPKHWPLLPTEDFMLRNPKSFVSVRDPYTRAVSCWLWCYGQTKYPLTFNQAKLGFEGWLQKAVDCYEDLGFYWPQHVASTVCLPQSYWLKLHNWDFVLKNETLQADFSKALNSFGALDLKLEVKNANRHVNKPAKTFTQLEWRAHYTSKAKQLVEKIWAEDFKSLERYYDNYETP